MADLHHNWCAHRYGAYKGQKGSKIVLYLKIKDGGCLHLGTDFGLHFDNIHDYHSIQNRNGWKNYCWILLSKKTA